jgi:hypothetical protein
MNNSATRIVEFAQPARAAANPDYRASALAQAGPKIITLRYGAARAAHG